MQRLRNQLLFISSTNEDVRRRGRILIILTLAMITMAVCTLPLVLLNTNQGLSVLFVIIGIMIMVTSGLLARRGAVSVGGVLLVCAVGAPTLVSLTLDQSQPTMIFFLAFPVVITGLVLRPIYIWIVFGVIGLVVFGIRVSEPAFFTNSRYQIDLLSSISFVFIIAALSFVGSWVTDAAIRRAHDAQADAEQSALALKATNAALDDRVAARTSELATALGEVERRSAQQEQLIHENEYQRVLIRELSVPVLPISATTLVMPLVGALDTKRLNDLQQQALSAIEHFRARRLLLDITGVPVVDTQVAQGLIRVVEAARLLGAEVVLVGIRPEVAQAVVGLGINLANTRSYSDLRSALAA